MSAQIYAFCVGDKVHYTVGTRVVYGTIIKVSETMALIQPIVHRHQAAWIPFIRLVLDKLPIDPSEDNVESVWVKFDEPEWARAKGLVLWRHEGRAGVKLLLKGGTRIHVFSESALLPREE